ncbi:bifunctional ADP-dependent NAD(P)H-hydrate dehydratase/NAD(P)H-hydrate epimerase [Janibacter anophelis]|uniref:bifunctional ADP-dependent NAD(P)H-hydrate dehydratase/NAD(P)H-hydrate epimerase n=1 Tax=Janibacter anophelis TaxID=319054 RepID=UPI00082B55FA|nr:bifunctional ADP-dependent NAD(P)H-hydrate dehydratase/NAD(P)H-hydrate epimerase [Janibacter anophelis]
MITGYSVETIRAAEAALPELLESGELMQRAARGVARIAAGRMRERGARAVTALVGPGNNGADTLFAVARLAKRGFVATAVCVDPEASDAQIEAAALARSRGVTVLTGDSREAITAISRAEVVLDGITGIGGRPGLPPFARPWVDAVRDHAWVISVDTPSGQPVEGGEALADAVFADETVTFGAPKPVHLLPPTEAACGLLTVIDIGLDLREATPAVVRLTPDDVSSLWPVPTADDDKYSRGVLGVIAGGEEYSGAAVLTTTAAVTAGVGMVRYVGTPTPTSLVRAAVPEAVHGEGRVQAWVVGPGLDPTSEAKGASAQLEVARAALASDLPVLVDAGGLDLVEGRREAPTLLTPHAGECARMLTRLRGRTTELTREEVEAAPLEHARALAGLTGASVLLKGSTTLVVDADGPVHVQDDAPPWLATAGAGDVLAGLAGALLAGGLDPTVAGSMAALVHGRAADLANPGGPVRALDVAHALGRTVSGLLAG